LPPRRRQRGEKEGKRDAVFFYRGGKKEGGKDPGDPTQSRPIHGRRNKLEKKKKKKEEGGKRRYRGWCNLHRKRRGKKKKRIESKNNNG